MSHYNNHPGKTGPLQIKPVEAKKGTSLSLCCSSVLGTIGHKHFNTNAAHLFILESFKIPKVGLVTNITKCTCAHMGRTHRQVCLYAEMQNLSCCEVTALTISLLCELIVYFTWEVPAACPQSLSHWRHA